MSGRAGVEWIGVHEMGLEGAWVCSCVWDRIVGGEVHTSILVII